MKQTEFNTGDIVAYLQYKWASPIKAEILKKNISSGEHLVRLIGGRHDGQERRITSRQVSNIWDASNDEGYQQQAEAEAQRAFVQKLGEAAQKEARDVAEELVNLLGLLGISGRVVHGPTVATGEGDFRVHYSRAAVAVWDTDTMLALLRPILEQKLTGIFNFTPMMDSDDESHTS